MARNGEPQVAVTGKTRVVGVWGHPVSHSKSPVMHNAALSALGLDWVYVPFDVSPDNIREAVNAIRALNLIGVNVTVPLKETVIDYLDEIDPIANAIGSVNTIVNKEGKLYGTSTDGPGFLRDLIVHGWPVKDKCVYLIGAGGSAKAIAYVLAKEGARIIVSNRTEHKAQALVKVIDELFPGSIQHIKWESARLEQSVDIIVNTTSVGMHPHDNEEPWVPEGIFESKPCVYDLIYAPEETLLLKRARLLGSPTLNGLGMLIQQGAISLAMWSGIPLEELPLVQMEHAVRYNTF